MPELPEVETVCRSLRNTILDKNIIGCKIYAEKCIKNCEPNEFINKIINQIFKKVERRGKHIILICKDYVVISHLRMEGKYFYLPVETEISMKHIMLTFYFDNGYCLHYHDSRKFGTFHLFQINNYSLLPPINKIGKEPFDLNLTAKELFEQ